MLCFIPNNILSFFILHISTNDCYVSTTRFRRSQRLEDGLGGLMGRSGVFGGAGLRASGADRFPGKLGWLGDLQPIICIYIIIFNIHNIDR